jgi:hypothetical protein
MGVHHEPELTNPPIDPALEDLSRDLVKSLIAAGDDFTGGVPPAVQHSLTVLCTTAHERGVPPEGVLTLVKKTWKSYLAHAEGLGVHELWYSDLISQCINDFYESAS